MSREDIRWQMQSDIEENVGTYDDPETMDTIERMLAEKSSKKSIGNKGEVPYNVQEWGNEEWEEQRNWDSNNMETKREKTIRNHMIASKVTAFLLAAVVLTGAGLCIKEYSDNQDIYNYYTQEGIDIAKENKRLTYDHEFHYYDEQKIAVRLAQDPDKFDFNLYGVYKEIDNNKLEKLDKILGFYGSIVNNRKGYTGLNYYNSFKDYCTKKGFLKSDGSIDEYAYEEGIKEQMRIQNEIDNLEDERKEFGAK